MLPCLVVLLPVAIISAGVTAFLYLGPFAEDPVVLAEQVDGETSRGLLFWLVVLGAAQALFSGVGSCATIVSIARALEGQRGGLAAALDVGFARMGAILGMAIIQLPLVIVTTGSVIGLIAIPVVARLALAPQVLVLENAKVLGAFRGSWLLTSRRIFNLLGVVALSGLVMLGPSVVFVLLGEIVSGTREQQVWLAALASVLRALILVPVVGFLTAAVTIFYLKARELDRERRPA